MPPIPGRARRGSRPVTLILAAALGGGCGRAASPPPAPTAAPGATAADECLLRPSGGGSQRATVESLRVAVDSGYAGLFDPARRRTPTTLSCTGEPRPALAKSWTSDSLGLAWTLVLGDTTAGAPSAAELATVWRERPEPAAALRWAGVTSVVPLDARRLVVTFDAARHTLPTVFADPALAFPSDPADSWSRITPGSGADLRDALDAGADVVVTADPEVVEYASSRAETSLAALPWSRTYVLLAPPGGTALGDIPGRDSAAFRAALARDAVHAAARGAEPPYWWERAGECEPAPPRSAGARSSSVLYPREDGVARSLAERIVALAGSAGVATRGVAAWELFHALAAGTGAGYVVPLPRVALVACRELAAWPAGYSVLPLVDTRATAVLRAGTPPLSVAWDGALAPAEAP